MRKRKLFWQLYLLNLVLIVVALGAFTYLTTRSFENRLLEQVSADLLLRAELMRDEITRTWRLEGEGAVQKICLDLGERTATRITVIGVGGRVIADSRHDPRTMENHGNRPEIRGAMAGAPSTYTRFSKTLDMNFMYAAVQVRDGGRIRGILRASVPLRTVETSVRVLQLQILLGGFVIAVLAGLVSYFVSRRITRPIEVVKQGARRFAAGDLEFRMPVPRSEELSDLAEVMNNMAEQLQQRISQITQQHSEQDAVLSSMVEGVIAFDMEERLININRSAATLLRINFEKTRGKSIQEVVRNVGLQRFVEQTMASGDATEGFITLVDEVERFLQVHGSILRDGQRRPLGVLVVMNDYTELRSLENVRREFVANVSHELKTPITSIKGYVETLLDGAINDKEDAVRFLEVVSRQADRLNAIIEDLLSLSRIEQGSDQERIAFEPASVCDVLHSAVQSCSVDAEVKGMRIQLECDPSLRAIVNPPLLEQAVVNLISNAIKYSDEGKRIDVTAVRTGTGQLRISVRDEGYGIEAEFLPRLFERFYRIDKARSRKLGGTGLGLAIVKHIAQAHHGQIDVSSTPGRGSEFTLILPGATPSSSTDIVRSQQQQDSR